MEVILASTRQRGRGAQPEAADAPVRRRVEIMYDEYQMNINNKYHYIFLWGLLINRTKFPH